MRDAEGLEDGLHQLLAACIQNSLRLRPCQSLLQWQSNYFVDQPIDLPDILVCVKAFENRHCLLLLVHRMVESSEAAQALCVCEEGNLPVPFHL